SRSTLNNHNLAGKKEKELIPKSSSKPSERTEHHRVVRPGVGHVRIKSQVLQ
ncbi:hypothetical protein N341_08461, partial [Tyto alba]